MNLQDQYRGDDFQNWLEQHVFSATELEGYQQCAYRFYASAFLRLQPDLSWDKELSPPEIGRLLHKVLEDFLKEASPLEGKDSKEEGLERINLLLDHELENILSQKTRVHLSPVLLRQQKERMKRTLSSFVEDFYRIRIEQRVLKPTYFEWAFGQEEKPFGISLPVDFLPLKGRVDRIDIDPIQKKFLIIDYKTGSKAPSGQKIRSGEALQIPLYILAVQELLLPDYEPIGGLYYELNDMSQSSGILHADRLPDGLEIHPRSSTLVPANEWEDLFKKLKSHLQRLFDQIKTGEFASEKKACTFSCPFYDICRVRSSYGSLEEGKGLFP